jgi:type I restriction enzyme S subunit
MNAERLLAHYERIADAPDAIARLRRFILDLAVRGKLVPQDANDEPASELLKRIAKEKARLVKAGEIRTPKASEPIRDDEPPIFVPQGWAWARLCDIGKLSGGMTPSMNRSDYWYGDIVWLSPKDIKSDEVADSELRISAIGLTETGLELYRPGCLFMVARSGILKRTFPVSINRVPAAANQDMKVLAPFLDGQERYLQIMFRGLMDFLLRELVKTGTTVQSLKYAEFEQQPFPLPPLAEQRRIVAKVDELMVLCDRLEAARGSREAVRDRLAAASLARLNAPDPQTFQEDARFALDALPALTTRPNQIKRLRQTIFNLAVRGKLVPQDPTDEPASELLMRIAKEIAAYAKANRIGQTQAEQIPTDDLPFSAPHGWQWTRLCALFKVVTDGDHQPPPKADEGVAFLTIGNITTGRLDFTGCRMVPETYFKSLAPYRTPAKGDVLYTVVGATYGRPAVVETDRDFCVQRHIAILKPAEAISLRFLVTLLASPLIYDQATRSTTGTAQPTIALRPLRNFLAPLPPLAEQHRIVAKVDALMALCDRLEASLTSTTATRRCLLDALLAEALAPREAREI